MSNPYNRQRRVSDNGVSDFVGSQEKSSNINFLLVGAAFARDGVSRQEATILDLTQNAVAALRRVIAEADDKDILGIRIAVCGSSCAGLSYQMGLEAEAREGDAVIHCDDVIVFVDEESKPLLNGTCVDFCESPAATGFVFDNPNNCSACGNRKSCGI